MPTPYHSGERQVQAQAGVRLEAARIANMIEEDISPVIQRLLRGTHTVVGATVAQDGRVWASLLTGPDGYFQIIDSSIVSICATLLPDDPIRTNLLQENALGLLVIDLETRRRIRLNGLAILKQECILLLTSQVYVNCPKYIQKRHVITLAHEQVRPSRSTVIHELSLAHQDWIRESDTFFIATAHATRGTDASHRGGLPGFIQVRDARTIVFPDYVGNMMFQTLGNLAVNPRAGLLFMDFENGNLLQLTGQARTLWDHAMLTSFAGAERLVEFTLDEGLFTPAGSPLRGQLINYSPFNP